MVLNCDRQLCQLSVLFFFVSKTFWNTVAISHLPPNDLDRDLSVDDEAVIPHVTHAHDQAEALVAFADDGLLAEHHRAGSEDRD